MLGINPIKNNLVQQPQCNCNCHCCQQTRVGQETSDAFVKHAGILPPKDWKPDKYAGLGPEVKLTPQEKLKKKWEDFKRPKYATEEQAQVQEQPEVQQKKSFKQKVKDFFKKLFHRN